MWWFAICICWGMITTMVSRRSLIHLWASLSYLLISSFLSSFSVPFSSILFSPSPHSCLSSPPGIAFPLLLLSGRDVWLYHQHDLRTVIPKVICPCNPWSDHLGRFSHSLIYYKAPFSSSRITSLYLSSKSRTFAWKAASLSYDSGLHVLDIFYHSFVSLLINRILWIIIYQFIVNVKWWISIWYLRSYGIFKVGILLFCLSRIYESFKS